MANSSPIVTKASAYIAVGSGTQNAINDTDATVVVRGTALADGIRAGKATLRVEGGLGDDVYYVGSKVDVVEKAGQGVDTVVSYLSAYHLPDNVENLSLPGDKTIGTGNAQANLLFGGSGSQTLNGMGGNDVLAGGAGSDMFVVGVGNGSDRILDFESGLDKIRLDGTKFTTFDAVRSQMIQQGNDVVLKISANETLTFNDMKIANFSARDFNLKIDLTGRAATFVDNFDTLRASPGGESVWRTTYGGGGRTLSSNNEAEYYSDSSVGTNPFRIRDGVLEITAAPAKNLPHNLTYTSGAITTEKSFSQLYGYFEMSAKLPAGQGFWPAFWLLPANGSWPPELDVMEMLGSDPSVYYATSHTKNPEAGTATGFRISSEDLSKGFHTFGVDWGPKELVWYLDGVEVSRAATPSDMHTPMYMLANLAVGAAGSWPGAADGKSTARMEIDYIRAYSAPKGTVSPPPSTISIVKQGTSRAEILKGGDKGDTLNGLDGNDTLYGMGGNDILRGGYGDDKLYGGLGNDQIGGKQGNDSLYGEAGNDMLWGDDGNDRLVGGAGRDTLYGGTGKDLFVMTKGMEKDVIGDFSIAADRLDLRAFTSFTKASKVYAALSSSGADTILKLSSTDAVTIKGVKIAALKGSDDWFVLAPAQAKPQAPKIASFHGTDRSETFAGTSKADHITAGKGNDVIKASNGNDIMDGGIGNDLIHGGEGHDRLIGGEGSDKLYGGNGNDRLDGGRGNDLLSGERGSDTFVFKAGFGRDTITDFTARGAEADHIEFDKALFRSAAAVFSHMHQSGHDLVIDIGSDHLVLKHMTAASLTADKLLFV